MKLSELLILAEFADKRGLFDLVEDKIWEDEKEVSHLLLAFLREFLSSLICLLFVYGEIDICY